MPRHIRVPVVPGREIRATERAGQLHPRHVQDRVADGPGGEHDRVVMPTQIRQAQIRAVVHVPQETDVPAVHDLVQRGDDPLDARMVRGHPVADQAERGRVPVEQVDADTEVPFLLGQDVRRVHPGGSGTDDGDAQRAVRASGHGGWVLFDDGGARRQDAGRGPAPARGIDPPVYRRDREEPG
ncbi:Uncharacterised protein [Streptococcus pneumoniae]|nr:Uncharacterised protein [Streptococcus pneumoniae]